MARVILLLLLIIGAVFASLWFSERPGQFSMEWLGHKIETKSIGVVLLGAAVLAGIVALIYRFWRFLLGSPAAIGRKMRDNKRKRGYKALSQGMVAIAAGDGPMADAYGALARRLIEGGMA